MSHEANIGKIVLYLARHHEPGDFGDCAVNNPVVNIIDRDGSAADFVLAVGRMSEQSAQAIVSQITASDNKPLLDWVRQMTDPVKQRQS